MNIYNFDEFETINESDTLNLYKRDSLFDKLMKKALKNSILKKKISVAFRYKVKHDGADSMQGYFFDENAHNFYINALYDYPKKEYQRILVMSKIPFDLKKIEHIFPADLIGNYGDTMYSLKREVLEEHLHTEAPIPFGNDGRLSVVRRYFVVFNYVETSEFKSSNLDVKAVMNLPEFKEFLEATGYVLKAEPKKMTFKFVFPSKMVAGVDERSNRMVNVETNYGKSEYIHQGYTLYASGYIRFEPTFTPEGQRFPDQPGVIGNFDATTLEGWKEGLKTLKQKVLKWQKKFEGENVKFFKTEEERHRYRGRISTSSVLGF
ncbi:MAG: hypothetical protein WCO84_09095 [bacterium]